MALITWGSALEVGNKDIDSQHKVLVDLVNGLNDAMTQGKGKEILGKLLKELIDYTVSHFAMEERLMQTHAYPDRDKHMKEHTDLKATVTKLQGEFASGKVTITLQVMSFLKEWLSNHILKTDKALGTYLASKNVK